MRKISPFINWAGGKSQLLSQMSPYLPQEQEYTRYIEPFLGGGVVFLTLKPSKAILGDSNGELMKCYTVVRDEVEGLIDRLSTHIRDRDYYCALRQQDPETMEPLARAARFIYLNKTCFNGVYRVNSRGQFNVPYGDRKAKIYDEENLRSISHLLNNVELVEQSYEKTLKAAGPYDFIYLDPPYYPSSRTANFAKYTSKPFGEDDHVELAQEFRRLTERGCRVLLSNSDTAFIRTLYSGYYSKILLARRYINCHGSGRKAVPELLIMNYEPSCSLD